MSASSATATTPAVFKHVIYVADSTEEHDNFFRNLGGVGGVEKYMIRPAFDGQHKKVDGVYTLLIKKEVPAGGGVPSKRKKYELIYYNISPVAGGKGKWQSVDRENKKVTYDSLTDLLIATGATTPHQDLNVVGARFLRVALALAAAREREQLAVAAAAADDHIETTHPINGRHMASSGPLIGRAYTSHEPLAGADAPLDPTLVEGRVSWFDQNAHVWTQMIAAEHKDHTLDVEHQTRKSAAAIIAAREQWSADWVLHYADAVNGEKLTAALCFGKHVPMPNDADSPLSILNTYAS